MQEELCGRRLLLSDRRHHFVRCPPPPPPTPPPHRPCLTPLTDNTNSCTTKQSYESCKSDHGVGKDVVSVPPRVSLSQPLCYRRTLYPHRPFPCPLPPPSPSRLHTHRRTTQALPLTLLRASLSSSLASRSPSFSSQVRPRMCIHMHDMYDARLPASRLQSCRARSRLQSLCALAQPPS